MTKPLAEATAELLASLGVEAAFGVVSVHNLPLVDALERSSIRYVATRTESAAFNAADAYGRVSGNPAVAVTSTGTGAANAAGASVEALNAGSPVIHLAGQIESRWLDQGRGVIHETKDQLGMLSAVSKAAYRITDREQALPVLAAAFEMATSAPAGPVAIDWPIDLQYAQVEDEGRHPRPSAGDSSVGDSRREMCDGRPISPEDRIRVLDALETVRASRRPLIWAGSGARGAAKQVAELAERLGAGILTSGGGRGTVPEDHELCVGNFAAHPGGRQLLAEGDLLVSIGTRFRSNETDNYRLQLPERHLQIDVDPAALGRVFPADVTLHLDASVALDQLLAADDLGERDPNWRRRCAEARLSARSTMRQQIGWQADVCDELRRLLPRDAAIVRDVTVAANLWGSRLLDVYHPSQSIYARGGGLGQGVAMAMGAALANPATVTVGLIGDGGFVYQLGELATIAELELPVVLLIFNDGGYGVMRTLQDKVFGRRAGVDLTVPNLRDLSGACGFGYQVLANRSEIAEVLAAALESGRPALVDIDVNSISEGVENDFLPPIEMHRQGAN